MFGTVYSYARPWGMLLRRLIEEGWALEDIPQRVTHMEADHDIEYRGKLRPPGRWWVVLISPEKSGHPNGKLSIVTREYGDPIDPNDILYVERPPPPKPPVVYVSTGLLKQRAEQAKVTTKLTAPPAPPTTQPSETAESEALEARAGDAAKWLAPQLTKNSKREDFQAACMAKFGLTDNAYETRVWLAARSLRGWSPQAPPGAKPGKPSIKS